MRGWPIDFGRLGETQGNYSPVSEVISDININSYVFQHKEGTIRVA